MKLKSLDTSNNYTDFFLPVLTLDKETGKGKWVEGADVFVQMHNSFRQEFKEEKTVIEWELETALNLIEEYFTITKDSIELKKKGFYELSIELYAKGKVDTSIGIEVSKDKELFGMRSAATFDSEGNLGLRMSRILELENNTLRFYLRKAAGQSIRLPYAASLVRIRKLKV